MLDLSSLRLEGLDAVDLVPLGVLGFFRWGSWLLKKAIGFFYRATKPGNYAATVSIVSPVYHEGPDDFEAALDSWIANKPDEIIAVIDNDDAECARRFDNKAHLHPEITMRYVMTSVPGKRPALALGARMATSEIIALVDSDTLWQEDALPRLIAPFENPKVAGVTCRQEIHEAKTLSQKLAAIVFELRYADEMPFLGRIGQGFSCLSGRTAVYRGEVLLSVLDEMLDETFLGRQSISGEDKRLTYLVQAKGYQTRYQDNVIVTTFAAPGLRTFLKQKVRWSRNTWRADLRALGQPWTWKRPVLALYLLDKSMSSFTVLVSPIFMALGAFHGSWELVASIGVWWLVSRFLKMLPYLARRPLDIWILPIFIVFGFVIGLIKLYALATVARQGWITRGARSQRQSLLSRISGTTVPYVVTGSLVAGIVLAAIAYGGVSQNGTWLALP